MANQEQLELLRQGIEGWNRWREEHSGVKVDLSGIYFINEERYISFANLSLVNLRGSSLSEADLSNTDLSEADLSNANLSNANLNCVILREADLSKANLSKADLDKVNLSGANLSEANLSGASLSEVNLSRIMLRGADLSNTSLSKANLSKVSLSGANLSEANLSGANLSEANLNEANLSKANLNEADMRATQMLSTNFTGAMLSGACLEDWNINNETNLHEVICEYVYLKQGKQERRPSNGTFKPGEFTALFQKALETIDLIFISGIDWQVFFRSFQELRSQYNDENISIQAIEKKSGGAFVVRLEVPPEADKAAIESHAKELYEMKLQLQEERYRVEFQAKDGQILLYQEQLEFHRQNNTNLMEIVKTMAEKENQPTHQTIINAQTIGATHTGSGDIANFTQNINSNIDDITKLITSLRDAAQTLPEVQCEEALVHLDDLQEDLSQTEKQKPNRLKTRLVALFAIASTASGVVVGTTDFGNKVLDLSKKLGIELIHTPPNQQLPPSK